MLYFSQTCRKPLLKNTRSTKSPRFFGRLFKSDMLLGLRSAEFQQDAILPMHAKTPTLSRFQSIWFVFNVLETVLQIVVVSCMRQCTKGRCLKVFRKGTMPWRPMSRSMATVSRQKRSRIISLSIIDRSNCVLMHLVPIMRKPMSHNNILFLEVANSQTRMVMVEANVERMANLAEVFPSKEKEKEKVVKVDSERISERIILALKTNVIFVMRRDIGRRIVSS